MIGRALIVEDVAETGDWLSGIVVAAYPDCEVAVARNMRDGLARVAATDFDLALIDLRLPDGSGLEVLRNMKLLQPKAVTIVTTVMSEDSHIVSALSAGASGYLLKETDTELLTRQLVQLTQGVPAISPAIARRIMEHFRRTGPVEDDEPALTPRESEVLGLIGRGMRNAEVAKALALADSTVASHIKSIYRKLGISSRAEAALLANRLGLSDRKHL
ncbi:response regulator [Hyphobacterium sp.]|uniref:response regulator n=1 Tax=Hyphobacterium sp. TaxID=2004662 RepID=UPI00374A5C0A